MKIRREVGSLFEEFHDEALIGRGIDEEVAGAGVGLAKAETAGLPCDNL